MFNIYATDYAPVDPITPPCDIVPIFIGYKGENKARCLVFDLTECVSTFGDGGFVISFIRQGDELPYLVTNTDRLDNNAIWIINSTDTAVDGYGMVQLQYIVDDVICKSALYRTVTFDSNGITGDVPDPYQDLLAQIAAYAATAEGAATTATAAANTATTAVENGIVTERSQRIAADNGLQQQITNLMGLAGAPVMANTAAAMTDSSKIYVYTGSEAGYTFGNWYYFNGAEWVSGGVYQASAVETDKTLSVENMAADAAACGDLKRQIMSAFVTESASGSIASFDDGADGVPVADLVVNITPKQSGTGDPSPTNVRSISGWDSVNIIQASKNLYNRALAEYNVPVYAADGSMGSYQDVSSVWIPVKPSTEYTYWLQPNAYQYYTRVIECTASKGFIRRYGVDSSYTDIEKTFTFTTTANTYWIQVAINQWNVENISRNNWEFMLCEGVPTAYEPFNGNVYNISLGSAGTVYGGQLDVTTGMLTVTHALLTKNTANMNNGENHPGWGGSGIKALIGSGYNKAFTSMLNIGNQFNANTIGNLDVIFLQTGTYGLTETEWKVKAMDVQILVELANPTSVQLSATDVRTLLGNNNIWSDTGSVASLEYRADTQLYIEKLTNPDNDMTADANIASGQYFMVNNTLYLATAAIASGATITPGTNCTETSLAAALNAINA